MSERVPTTAMPMPPIEDADGHNLVIRELEALVESLLSLDRLATSTKNPEVRRRALELRSSFNRRAAEFASWLRKQAEDSGSALIQKAMDGKLRTK